MEALTAAVNGASASDYTGNARVTLGTIEATMSRVVDIDSEYLVTVATSVPTLQLLSAIEFNSTTQTWHIVYEVMGRDAASDLNQYQRTLYLTKGGNAHAGDHENACLSASVADSVCLQELRAKYIVPGVLSASQDNLVFGEGLIQSTVTSHQHSLMQTLEVSIPHTVVKSLLARRETRVSAAFGTQVQYSFGVGVLFLLAGRNTILFDSFELTENGQAQALIAKTVSYSIARHVSFFTEVVHSDTRIRLLSVEYLIEAGHGLQNLTASVNGHTVTPEECELARVRIAALQDDSCLQDRVICSIVPYDSADSGMGYSWVTYTMPIPAAVVEAQLLVNTLLDTVDLSTGTQLWSTINFKTVNSPRPVCTEVQVTAFNPTQYAKAVLYQSVRLDAQPLSSSMHTVSNATVNGQAALTMADAVMTLVLSPGDAATALDYFTQNADEVLRLDEVYMSHAKPYVEFPSNVRNVLHSVSQDDGTHTGRSSIIMDPDLLQTCPLESDNAFTYGPGSFSCVTTHDWGIDAGGMRRPHSAVDTDFVYEVRHTEDDKAWLQANIFGSSQAGASAADDFIARVNALTSEDRRVHTRAYWIWPLYAWPDEAPVGLKDKTVLSLAWSMSTASRRRRRLLATSPSVVAAALPVGFRRRHARLPQRRFIDVGNLTNKHTHHVVAVRPVHLQALHHLRMNASRPSRA